MHQFILDDDAGEFVQLEVSTPFHKLDGTRGQVLRYNIKDDAWSMGPGLPLNDQAHMRDPEAITVGCFA